MGNFCIDIGAHGAVSGIREEHFKKRDELSKLTENSWTCCCLVTEMRSSAQGVLSFTMMRSRLCEE